MKALQWVMAIAVLASQAINASAADEKLVRKPGHYPLDKSGSSLVITRQSDGGWSLKASWRSENETSEVRPDRALVADGWFVLIERPDRLWVFDGVESIQLLSHSTTEMGSSHLPVSRSRSYPREVWEALPETLRTKYPRSGGAPATASDPAKPDK